MTTTYLAPQWSASSGCTLRTPGEEETGQAKDIYCRYLFPRELRDFDSEHNGTVEDDPHRAGLRNLFLARNDSLLNNFEEHILLMNLGNIDWRPLINLWSVLAYLTKYTSKVGSSSKSIASVFDETIKNVLEFETEDGLHDLWRRSIMKYYNRILGSRDYSLFLKSCTSAYVFQEPCLTSAMSTTLQWVHGARSRPGLHWTI